MVHKTIVISLGGSLIIPDNVDINFLKQFKKIIDKHKNKYKFVVVTGGGSIARKYIKALREAGKSEFLQSMIGISCTRTNARFLTYIFGKDANEGIPHNMLQVKNLLKKNNPVFCGALRYSKNQTSDTTAAKLARFFNCEFINLTLVSGLYTKNPLKHKDARFIPKISWEEFEKMANKEKFKPGQHFVLDQSASKIIRKHRIRTYILGKDLRNFDLFLQGGEFKGTIINGN